MSPELKAAKEQAKREFYSNWDWTKQDVHLAIEHKLTRERIRQIRKFMGAPQSPTHKKQIYTKTFETRSYIEQDRDTYAKLFKEHTLTELAEILSTSITTVHHWAKDFGFKVRRAMGNRKYPWEVFDWDLPTHILGKIWGVKYQSYTSYHRLSPPIYDGRSNITDLDYQRKVEQQQVLAKQGMKIQHTYSNKKEPTTLLTKMEVLPMRRAMLDIMKSRRVPFDYQKAKEVVDSVANMPYFYVNDDGAGFASLDNTLVSDGEGRETTLDEIMTKLANWEASVQVPNSSIEVRLYADGSIKVGSLILDSVTSQAMYEAKTKMNRKMKDKARWANEVAKRQAA